MEPKLSTEIMTGLKRMGNSTLVSDEVFVKSLQCGMTTITQPDFTSANLSKTKANWPQTRCKMLADAYAACVSKVQACLSNISVHPPHIVDVQWSLNHNTKSSSNKQTTSSFVSVQFETEGLPEGQEDKLVKFECTLAELQDMVSKLKEALRQVEHIAHI
ncbi:COMM domain-containing protein 3 isoform X2 [Frankliniella occidentalis]|uniref:COMM domain-containing protein 3 n=1 Tax=Frankliniella occidentalis TaxID=133901 RepID=A0A6J1S129_FRAOC|nr:COMM domain-containing protein 3 isoform X2 [Frankliniella occidentalis]